MRQLETEPAALSFKEICILPWAFSQDCPENCLALWLNTQILESNLLVFEPSSATDLRTSGKRENLGSKQFKFSKRDSKVIRPLQKYERGSDGLGRPWEKHLTWQIFPEVSPGNKNDIAR